MIRNTWRIILINQNHFLTTIWNQNDLFRNFGQFWLNFHRLRFSLPEGARARQYTQNDRKEHLCRKTKKYFGFDQFLNEFREENDIFAHMGAHAIFKGILVENRNFWLNLEISGPEISADP